MEPSTVQAEIRQLESIRKQAFWWRTGALLALVGIVGGSLLALNASVRGLAQAGPPQEAFVAEFSRGLQSEVIPDVEALTRQTLSEIQPQIQTEFAAWNGRVPELSNAVVRELETLQADLPKKSEKTLDDAFRTLLTSREGKIREMYPEVTPEQVSALVTNLQKTGEEEIRSANDELFAPHQASLVSIMEHMETIRTTSPALAAGIDPNWAMGLAVLDVLRDDLKDLGTPAPKPTTGKAAVKG